MVDILDKYRLVGALLFAALCLTFVSACSEDEGTLVASYAENGRQYSPSSLTFDVSMYKKLDAVQLDVVRLDYDYSPLDTIEAAVKVNGWSDKNVFVTDTVKFPSPYVKVVLTVNADCRLVFEYYMDISDSLKKTLGLVEAVAAERIEHLVFEKKKKLSAAIESAIKEIRTIRDEESPNDFVYLYCRFENSDSLFYSDFLELKRLLAEGPAIPHSFEVRTADEILSHYDGFVWNGVRITENGKWLAASLAFMDRVYDFRECSLANQGDTLVLGDSLSEYDGRTFVCDRMFRRGSDSYTYVYEGWRLGSDMESTLGGCNYDMVNTAFYEGSLYYCKEDSSGWVKEEL